MKSDHIASRTTDSAKWIGPFDGFNNRPPMNDVPALVGRTIKIKMHSNKYSFVELVCGAYYVALLNDSKTIVIGVVVATKTYTCCDTDACIDDVRFPFFFLILPFFLSLLCDLKFICLAQDATIMRSLIIFYNTNLLFLYLNVTPFHRRNEVGKKRGQEVRILVRKCHFFRCKVCTDAR